MQNPYENETYVWVVLFLLLLLICAGFGYWLSMR